MARILIADDDPDCRSVLKTFLDSLGHSVSEAPDGKKAVAGACSAAYDLIILSLDLPKAAGMRTLRAILDECPEIPVIVTAESRSARTAVDAVKLGAFQYVTKPLNPEEVRIAAEPAMAQSSMMDRTRRLVIELKACYGFENLVATSKAAKAAYSLAAKAARTDSPVVLIGEPGTGKGCVARAIHYESPRAAAPFVKVNCVGIPESQLEKELFGYEKGAVASAIGRRAGHIERADGGTVFVDGVEAMGPKTQARLLRLMREKQFERIGGACPIASDVRIIAAAGTNPAGSPLMDPDLCRELSAVTVTLPPLRERQEDMPILVEHFIRKHAHESGKSASSISESAMAYLLLCEWHGNIRELENCIERAVIACDGSCIQPVHLALNGSVQSALSIRKPQGRLKSLREVERDHIKKVLLHCDWNRSAAASILEIDRKTLRSKIREFGFIAPGEK